MTARRRTFRTVASAAALLVTAGLSACGDGGSSPGADPTRSAGTPTSSATSPAADSGSSPTSISADERLRTVVKPMLREGSGHEEIYFGGTSLEFDVGWLAGGRIYDKHVPSPEVGVPGRQLRHTPGAAMERYSDGGESCWFPAGVDTPYAARPLAPEVALLRSVRASSGGRFTLHGSVEIQPLLQFLGPDAQLRKEHLVAPPRMRTPVTFQVSEDGVVLEVNGARVIRQLGLTAKPGRWTWQVSLESGRPALPPITPGRRIDVPRTDPSFLARLQVRSASPRRRVNRHDMRMKRVSHTLTYPGTTVDAVYAMLADPAYRQAVGDYQKVTDFSCDITPSGNGMKVRLEQAHATDRIPSFAQKLVGGEIRFAQEETWSSPAGADIHVVIPGKPGDMTGGTSLTQSGDDVVQRIDLDVKVSIPLVGGKVEDLIAGFVGKAFAAENKVGVKWLRDEWCA